MKTTGYITPDGKYIRTDKAPKIADETNAVHKQYSHDRQRENHRADIVQPYINGQPNPEFINLYPEESKSYGFIQ